MRALRTGAGVLLLLVGIPLLFGAVGLWLIHAHRGPDGSFAATLDPVPTDGYALVVPDVDRLLRQDAPFVRGGQTTLRIEARVDRGSAFVGLAPTEAVTRYLAGVRFQQIDEVKLTRGRLPVRLSPDTAAPPSGQPVASPPPPTDQPFWLVRSSSEPIGADSAIDWTPSAVRGERLALVVMSADGMSPVRVGLRASITVAWLKSTAWGVLVLGVVLLIAGLALLCWRERPREFVYVVGWGPPVQRVGASRRAGVAAGKGVPPTAKAAAGTSAAGSSSLAGMPSARPAVDLRLDYQRSCEEQSGPSGRDEPRGRRGRDEQPRVGWRPNPERSVDPERLTKPASGSRPGSGSRPQPGSRPGSQPMPEWPPTRGEPAGFPWLAGPRH